MPSVDDEMRFSTPERKAAGSCGWLGFRLAFAGSRPLCKGVMHKHAHISGVILAGGGGRRMFPDKREGGDKSLVRLAGAPLIGHVIGRLAGQVDRIIINANADPGRYSQFGVEVVPDIGGPDQGPLAGLLAAFDWAGRQDPPVEAVVSVSTDTPFLPANLVARLNAHSDDGAAIASSEGRIHPVVGLWPVALRPVLETALSERRRSVEKFARLIEAVEVPFPHVTIASRSVDPFFNANTPGDLELAREILQS